VSTYLKVGSALGFIVILGVCLMLAHRADEAVHCDTITFAGDLTPEAFVEMRDCLVRSSAAQKRFVVTTSGGGSAQAALAIATLIHEHNWDVEIVDFCASSCANFIFPAGRVKYLNKNAMLLFHGGPHQRNLLDMAVEADRAAKMSGADITSKTFGQVAKEGSIYFEVSSDASREVQEFLSIKAGSSLVELVHQLRSLSDEFYRKLGVNPLLPEYGQIGPYESTYKSYNHIGFMYRLDSLRRLGITNIELKDGEWHPERHPAYERVYEVVYP
jgi:ATP-dependent protease ClpP protease subunit